MKNILTVLKKELKVVFGNRRLLFSVVLMPGLMIFVMYTVMGQAIKSRTSDKAETYQLAIVDDAPADFIANIPEKYEIEKIATTDLEVYKQKVFDGDYEVILEFPQNAVELMQNKTSFDVGVYYNPSEVSSESAYQQLSSLLSEYQSQKMIEIYETDHVFSINGDAQKDYEIFDEKKASASMIAMLLPFLLITLLFSAAVSVTPESIAGEKERGTLATLLVTQVKRSEIAIGKIISLSILASLSGISSFLGVILSMPSLMGGTSLTYSVGDYALILVIVISSVLLITGLLSLISAFAKTVKEATMLASPLMILSMVIGISTMMTGSAPTNHALYFIPIYNSVEAMAGILSMEINYVNIIITAVSNVVYTAAAAFVLSKMFNSEKIMFSR